MNSHPVHSRKNHAAIVLRRIACLSLAIATLCSFAACESEQPPPAIATDPPSATPSDAEVLVIGDPNGQLTLSAAEHYEETVKSLNILMATKHDERWNCRKKGKDSTACLNCCAKSSDISGCLLCCGNGCGNTACFGSHACSTSDQTNCTGGDC